MAQHASKSAHTSAQLQQSGACPRRRSAVLLAEQLMRRRVSPPSACSGCRMGPPALPSTFCLTRCATCSSVRCAGCLVPALVARPAFRPLRPAGSSSARCAAGCGRWAPRGGGAGCSRILAGRPQAQVEVVLSRPGQLPVRAQEQRVGPGPRRRRRHPPPVRGRAEAKTGHHDPRAAGGAQGAAEVVQGAQPEVQRPASNRLARDFLKAAAGAAEDPGRARTASARCAAAG